MRWSQSDLVAYEMRQRHNAQRGEAVSATAVPDGQEGALHEEVLRYCKDRGWICIHSRPDRPSTNAVGTFDCVVLADSGRTYLIELKTRTGKLTLEQAGMQAWALKLGHKAAVCRSLTEFIEATKI